MSTNKVLIISAIIIVILAISVLLTGGVRKDVVLKNYDLSTDGTTMTIKVNVTSKIGYVRKMKLVKEGNDVYIKFYSSFGFNSKMSNHTYNIDIVNIDDIYFYVGKAGYKKVLELRNKEWIVPNNTITVNKNV